MPSLVQELEQEAYDSKASLSNMLRKAKAIAVKLQLKQPIAWVEAELNGYETDEVPNYRKISGRVKARNPYVGLIPMICPDRELERLISEHWIREPISSIEHTLATAKEPMLPITGEKAKFLAQHSDTPDFPMFLFFAPSSLVSILDAVRNRILDWSLALQSDGIFGDGMSFRPEEKMTANSKGDIYNIGSIGNFAGNLGGQVTGNVSGVVTQQFEIEFDKVRTLINQIRQHQNQLGLMPQQEIEVNRTVNALDEELRGKKPKEGIVKSLLASLKTTLEGTAGNLIASGILAVISNVNL